MSNSVPVIKLAFSMDWKVLSHAIDSDPTFEVQEFANASEAATFLSGVKSALVLASLSKKDDLIQIAALMKIYKKVAPDTIVKVIVVNFAADKTYEKATAKLGIQDLIDPGINTKALRFKIDFWMKGLVAQLKKTEATLAAKAKSIENAKVADKKASDAQAPRWQEALDLEDDVWLLKDEADCKRVLGKWLVRLRGPSPYVGQWNEVNGRNNLWKFEFKTVERERFLTGGGNWFFKGDQKPDFVWKENQWLITGSAYDLYYQNSKQIISRLSLKDKVLTICKNSEYAKTKEEIIIESFDKEMVFRREGNFNTTDEVDTEGGNDKFGNLEGKGKTNKLQNNPLSGKTKGTDDLTTGLLAMDLGKSAKKENGPLVGPSGASVKEGKLLDLENKKNEHKTHSQDHNEAEKYEASRRERKEHSSEMEQGEEYGGKSNTDKLSKHYNNDGKLNSPHKEGEKHAQGQSDLSDLEREKESKKARKDSMEAKEREALAREEREKRERVLKEDEVYEKTKLDNRRKKGSSAAAGERDHEAEAEGEPNKQCGKKREERNEEEREADSLDDLEEAFGSKPLREVTEEEDQEEEDLFPKRRDFKPRPQKDLSKEVLFKRGGKALSSSRNEDSSIVHSIAEAKIKRESERVPEEEVDPEMDEALQAAEIVSFLMQNNEKISCRLDDYFDQSIIFTTKEGAFDNTNTIALDLSFDYLKKIARLNFEASIKNIDQDEEGTKYVTVEIKPENVNAFEAFMKLYQLRQKNVNFFLKRVKGL